MRRVYTKLVKLTFNKALRTRPFLIGPIRSSSVHWVIGFGSLNENSVHWFTFLKFKKAFSDLFVSFKQNEITQWIQKDSF